MADFNSGFREGDKIDFVGQGYIRVKDMYNRMFTIGANGDRRMWVNTPDGFDPPLDKPAATGPLSLAELKNSTSNGSSEQKQ